MTSDKPRHTEGPIDAAFTSWWRAVTRRPPWPRPVSKKETFRAGFVAGAEPIPALRAALEALANEYEETFDFDVPTPELTQARAALALAQEEKE